jgi:hypothetical protein
MLNKYLNNIGSKWRRIISQPGAPSYLCPSVVTPNTRVIQKVRFPIFYLNKITNRVTHEAEIQSHIRFTSPHSHQVCLYTYHSDVSTCQVLHKEKKMRPRHVTIFDFILNILIGMEALTSEVLFHLWE